MRMRTRSACVVLALSVLLILTAVGLTRSVRLAPASTRTASYTQITPGIAPGTTITTLTGTPRHPAARPQGRFARYFVQPGDTLTGIAAALAVPGGWPALYAANRAVIGPDPDVLDAGAVLVLPGALAPARYTVAAGDTLTGIAAALAVPGGWPALYAANQAVIGPDPDAIRPGTVLTIPGRAAVPAPASPPGSGPAPPRPAPPATPPARPRHSPPARTGTPAAAGMPHWLTTMLLAAGLLIAAAFLAEPVLAIARRRRARLPAAQAPAAQAPAARIPAPAAGLPPAPAAADAPPARIIMADFGRVVVTRSPADGTACVLRPPGTDPQAILAVARLVLPEPSCQELAAQLGLPASWPIMVADHDQVVVTRSQPDGTVCVLRPPGTDPRAILAAARLVLPEEPYEELAGQLGAPAGWPMTVLPDAS